jgi:hypothetical protein
VTSRKKRPTVQRAASSKSGSTAAGKPACARAAAGGVPKGLPYAAIAVVVLLIGALVIVKATQKSKAATETRPAPAAVVTQMTTLPPSAFETAGAPSGTANMTALPAGTPPLTSNGKPEVLYVGAEYCPFCAAERWPLTIALSRFGSFSNLGQTESATADVYPNTHTFSFYGSTYTSPYLTFTPVEMETNQPASGGGYTPLQALSAEQQRLVQTYGVPPYVRGSGIPFGDLGGRYLISGASYDPNLLKGRSMEQIAEQVADPTTDIGKAVLASANRYTAALCQLTNGRPGSVCSSQVIKLAAASLPKPI